MDETNVTEKRLAGVDQGKNDRQQLFIDLVRLCGDYCMEQGIDSDSCGVLVGMLESELRLYLSKRQLGSKLKLNEDAIDAIAESAFRAYLDGEGDECGVARAVARLKKAEKKRESEPVKPKEEYCVTCAVLFDADGNPYAVPETVPLRNTPLSVRVLAGTIIRQVEAVDKRLYVIGHHPTNVTALVDRRVWLTRVGSIVPAGLIWIGPVVGRPGIYAFVEPG